MGFVQPSAGFGLHEQRRAASRCCPAAAGLVERIVDPGQWALVASEVVYRLQFPVGAGFPWVAFELQIRQIAGQPEPLRQVIICLLLPAGAPNKLKMITQPRQVPGCAGRTEMKYSVYVKPLSFWLSGGIEAKQRYDPVNIDEQKRLA